MDSSKHVISANKVPLQIEVCKGREEKGEKKDCTPRPYPEEPRRGAWEQAGWKAEGTGDEEPELARRCSKVP